MKKRAKKQNENIYFFPQQKRMSLQVGQQVRLKQVCDIVKIDGDEVIVDMDGAERVYFKSELVLATQHLLPGDIVVKQHGSSDDFTVVQAQKSERPYDGLSFYTSQGKHAYWSSEILGFATAEERAEFFSEKKKHLQKELDEHLAHLQKEIQEKISEHQKTVEEFQAMIDQVEKQK